MSRSDRLAELHRRYDGPIPAGLRRRAFYPTEDAYEAARARGIAAHLARQIVTTARAMTATLAAGRSDARALTRPSLIGLAGDLSIYVRERRSRLAVATRP